MVPMILALLVMLLLFPLSSEAQEEQELDRFALAVKLYEDGFYDAAISELDGILRDHPETPQKDRALYLLGEAHRKAGVAEAAADAFRRLLEETPGSPFAYSAAHSLGRLLYSRGEYVQAIDAFQKQLQEERPGNLDEAARYLSADANYRTGQYEKAATAYGDLLDRYPGGQYEEPSLYSLGWSHRKRGDLEAAAETFRSLLERYPNSSYQPQVLYLLGEHHYRQGALQEAIILLRAFVDAQPENPNSQAALTMLADSYLRTGDEPAARQELRQLIERFPAGDTASDALHKLALLEFREGAYDVAARLLTQVIEAGGSTYRESALYWRGRALEELGNAAGALEDFQGVLAEFPEGPFAERALKSGALLHEANQEFDKAAPLWQALLEKGQQPDDRLLAEYRLAEGAARSADYARAIPLYEGVIARSPESRYARDARLKLALSYLRNENPTGAWSVLDPLLATASPDAEGKEILLLAAQAQLKLGGFQEAASLLRRLARDFPESADDPDLLYNLGLSLKEAGQAEEALSAFSRLLVVAPDYPGRDRASYQAGRIQYEASRWQEAVASFQEAARSAQPSLAAESLFWLGEAHVRLGQPDAALAALGELAARYGGEAPWNALAASRRGALYEERQEWDLALQAYEQIEAASEDLSLLELARQRRSKIEEYLAKVSPPEAADAARKAAEGEAFPPATPDVQPESEEPSSPPEGNP